VQALGRVYAFEGDQAAKRMLVEGLDAIALTQTRWEVIEAFHQARKASRPWVF